MTATAEFLSPPAAAKLLKIDPSKILAWINRGELLAVNLAASTSGRPRWRIAPDDLQAFLNRRASQSPKPTRRRRIKPAGVVEFFT